MPRLKYSLLAVAGLVLLAVVLSIIGPKRALAALGYTPIMDVENPGLHPFANVLYHGGSFTVPARQRLVIDTIDGDGDANNSVFGFQLITHTNGDASDVGMQHTFPATLMAQEGNVSYYATTQHVQLYADPGTTVQFYLATRAGTDKSSGRLNISGHLVDIP